MMAIPVSLLKSRARVSSSQIHLNHSGGNMKGRSFMNQSAGLAALVAASTLPESLARPLSTLSFAEVTASKLTPPAKGKIPVAFAISEDVTVIDFAGPWEVFQDVMIEQRGSDHE